MPFLLVARDGTLKFDLKDGTVLVVGRAPTSDIPVPDPTISRRHAEVHCSADGVRVKDLGSSNGTFVNDARIEEMELAVGDRVTFGKVEFKLLLPVTTPTAPPRPVAPSPAPGDTPKGTIVRQVGAGNQTMLGIAALRATPAPFPEAAGSGSAPAMPATVAAADAKMQQKLAKLLEVATGLGRSGDLDALLNRIVKYAHETLGVDRVAILLTDDSGELVMKITRDKRGGESSRAVPQSIARKAVAEKVAMLSDNAAEDSRFGGQSILMQQIRSAICCPLVGSDDRVLGVLYVDNNSATHRLTEEDLDYCVAFAGIAAVNIDNEQYALRIQRELLVRSNFERYFAPALAERIASSPGATRLGGEKRPVAVLFSDIRGFTALSETMRPDDMATLLTEYFTEMVECVFRHVGTLDKFIGDAVMAQWGAPIKGADDADRAMASAIEMMRELAKLNAKWRVEGRPEVQIGIGLNFGEAFAGNIGSERRLEFTVIGDTVNTASRLCGAAGPGEILISEAMRLALSSPPPLEVVPPMELKNKSQPVTVYRVVL